MRFLVPQFIEIEDKLFGPLTFKQFIYLVGGFGFAGMLFTVYGLWAAVLFGSPFVLLSLALAFYKVNDRPFIMLFQAMFNYVYKRKLYLWKKSTPAMQGKASEMKAATQPALKPYAPHVTESRLKELAWSLDIKETLGDQ